MKMYGYIANDKSLLFVRSKKEHVTGSFIGHIKRKLGVSGQAAEDYIANNYKLVEIEYNEVT